MRSWLFLLCLNFLSSAQDYVCNVANFRRMVGNVQIKAEGYYARVVTSAQEIADTLTYSSSHPNYFPGVYKVSDLTPCNSTAPDQFSLKGPGKLMGIQVLNRSKSGINFTFAEVTEELDFITPIANFMPTILKHNPDATTIYVAGTSLNCSSFYFYPYRDACGTIPMMDICAFYNARYNLFSKASDMEKDYSEGGHWSEPYTDNRGNLIITYSFPVKDATGKFRAQLGLGLGSNGVGTLVDMSKPSANGYTFIMNTAGNIIYAPQGAIDILFGVEANLTLRKITSSYAGGLGNVMRNAAVSLKQSKTAFAGLTDILTGEETNGSAYLPNLDPDLDGHYIAWSRFEETLRTWFLVGITPKNDLDNAAVWNITPSVREVYLSDQNPVADIEVTATNYGLLPFNFFVGSNPHSRGVNINTSSARYVLQPGASQVVDFTIQMDLSRVEQQSFTTHFVTPFFSGSAGYGSCFKPLVSEMIVHVARQVYYIPTLWATTIIFLLCGITAPLILGALIALFCFRYSPPVLAIAPRLCVLKLSGLYLVLAAAVLNILSPTVTLCEWTRWLLHLGFTMSVATIAAKNYRNRRIFTSKKLQVVALSDFKLMAFVAACLLVDTILLLCATFTERYVLEIDGHCELEGYVTYSLLLVTKILLWMAAFWNTLKIANVPSTFADTRLNAVMIVIALLAIIRLALQFTNALADNIGIQMFLGSLFMWFACFLVWAHFLLKLRAGYITVARPRSSTKNGSISLSMTQPKLKERLETLLLEVEAQSARLLLEKNNASESVKANQRLMFEVRAELLAINTQSHLVDDELERFLPSSIKAAFDKFGPAMARRMDISRPPNSRPRHHSKIADGAATEARQLLSIESPTGHSPLINSSSMYATPSTTRDTFTEDPRNRVDSDDSTRPRMDSESMRPRMDSDYMRPRNDSEYILRARIDSEDGSNPRAHFPRNPEERVSTVHFPPISSLKEKSEETEDDTVGESTTAGDRDDSSTQEEDTPLARRR